MINLEEVLSMYKAEQVDTFLKKHTGFDLNESNLKYSDISKNFKFLGGSESNGSNVGQLTKGEKGLVERITNAIDAVIEYEKNKNNIHSAKNSKEIIKKAFPKYYEVLSKINRDDEYARLSAKEAENKVIVSINDGSKSNKPTIDVCDKGTGINGEDFATTVLSLNHGNKLSSEKSYVIGAFGQGGSTSLPFTDSTIIVSKKEGKFYFTIIKAVELKDYKNRVYVYLVLNNKIPELQVCDNDSIFDDYLFDFAYGGESGTLIRMVETEISRDYRKNGVTKPGMLGDYLNTELFSVGLPVKLIENRLDFKDVESNQNRYIYGSYFKLQTTKKYIKKEYSGNIDIDHNNRNYKVEYFVLLPNEEDKWGIESECKSVFQQFNAYFDPIIYTVNGQTICSERYTKLNNAGLNFLRYRLLVVINLDVLGVEKYKFFTTDRARIVESDLTRGFLDKVIQSLASCAKLKEINEIIGEKSVSTAIDRDVLNNVAKKVQNQYGRFLKTGTLLSGAKGRKYHPMDEEIFEDHIDELLITSQKREFYKDENIVFVVTTRAKKHINEKALIYLYVDGKYFYQYVKKGVRTKSWTLN